jgi:Na+-transporting NADH:ubiquinone oxidoreductase subunit NqrB
MVRTDPRYFQIAALSSLVIAGATALDFDLTAAHALAIVVTALAVQWLGTRLAGLPSFDPLSATITSLSLTLLLRTDSLLLAVVAAALAIGSKFLVRVGDKHVFNPANFALVVVTLVSDHAWISTGQWGSASLAAIGLCALGLLVLSRARRFETTLSFLGVYAILLLARAAWLGDPLAIPLHQLQNGALLVFSLFMISDPVTTPNAPVGRLLFGVLVAGVSYVLAFVFFIPGAPVYALVLCALLTPSIDRALKGRRYDWQSPFTRQGVSPCEPSSSPSAVR